MAKRGYGIDFNPAPRLGIRTRQDLDRLCHYELREEINTYLSIRSSLDAPGAPGFDIVLVAVNPDGERRASHDFLCFWFPIAKVRHLVDHFLNAPLGTDEFRWDCREWERRRKQFRAGALELWKENKRKTRELHQQEKSALERQLEYERRLLEREC